MKLFGIKECPKIPGTENKGAHALTDKQWWIIFLNKTMTKLKVLVLFV